MPEARPESSLVPGSAGSGRTTTALLYKPPGTGPLEIQYLRPIAISRVPPRLPLDDLESPAYFRGMETLESLRAKFLDSQPAPLPAEAYEPGDPRSGRRHKQTLRESHAIPKWGWWVIGIALLVVGGAAAFIYFGEEAIVASMPALLLWLGFAVVALAALVVYFLPAVIAVNYRVRRSGAITVMNLLLGWTFIGWALALVWSIAEVESR